jgi:ABC-type sugar transport system substrate-binding protein
MKGHRRASGFAGALLIAVLALVLAACGSDGGSSSSKTTSAGGGGDGAASAKGQTYGLVLHLRIPFTQQIQQGAEDAARDMGAKLRVVGPTNLDPPTEVRDFQSLSTTGVKGIAAAAATPEIWARPVRTVQQAGMPVVTLNAGYVDLGAESPPYVGVNEVNAGRALAKLVLDNLPKNAKGYVVLGNGQPGAPPLEDRTKGFKAQMAESAPQVKVRGPYNVGQDPSANFAQWQNVINANRGALAYVGITAVDLPNLAKIKRADKGAKYKVASFDLQPDSLKAVKDGVAIGTIGQSPYLQGYIPIRMLIEHENAGLKLPMDSWIDPGTEVVDRKNIDEIMAREGSPAQTKAYYAPKVKQIFSDLGAAARPLSQQRQ